MASSWAKARRSSCMKRLADAERDGDKIYAVLRGIGGIERRQGKRHHRAQSRRPEILPSNAPGRMPGCRPPPPPMEGHGTSTRVGDVVEVQSMADVLAESSASGRLGGAGFGEVEHRALKGRGRRRRNAEDSSGAARQGAAAQRALRAPQSGYRFRALVRFTSTPN